MHTGPMIRKDEMNASAWIDVFERSAFIRRATMPAKARQSKRGG